MKTVIAGARPRQVGDHWANDLSPELDEASRAEWEQLVDRIQPATALVTLADLTPFRTWGPTIARFSFLLSPLAAATEEPSQPGRKPGTQPDQRSGASGLNPKTAD
jgi:hypothetical protein